jgi:hypothetical protein
MKRILLAAAAALSFASPAMATDYASIGEMVHMRLTDTVGCMDENNLLAWKKEVPPGVVPSVGWQDRLTSIGCMANATDLDWKIVSIDGPIIYAQLYYQGAPEPMTMWFVSTDLVAAK